MTLALFLSNHSDPLYLTSFPIFPSGGEILIFWGDQDCQCHHQKHTKESQITVAELIKDITILLLLPQDITRSLLFIYWQI